MVYGRYNELVFMGFVNQLIHITFGGTILYKVGPPNDSVQLVQITPITMIYATYNYSIHGVYKPSNITGGHHPVPPLRLLETSRNAKRDEQPEWFSWGNWRLSTLW